MPLPATEEPRRPLNTPSSTRVVPVGGEATVFPNHQRRLPRHTIAPKPNWCDQTQHRRLGHVSKAEVRHRRRHQTPSMGEAVCLLPISPCFRGSSEVFISPCRRPLTAHVRIISPQPERGEELRRRGSLRWRTRVPSEREAGPDRGARQLHVGTSALSSDAVAQVLSLSRCLPHVGVPRSSLCCSPQQPCSRALPAMCGPVSDEQLTSISVLTLASSAWRMWHDFAFPALGFHANAPAPDSRTETNGVRGQRHGSSCSRSAPAHCRRNPRGDTFASDSTQCHSDERAQFQFSGLVSLPQNPAHTESLFPETVQLLQRSVLETTVPPRSGYVRRFLGPRSLSSLGPHSKPPHRFFKSYFEHVRTSGQVFFTVREKPQQQ